MSRIRGSNTGLELQVFAALDALGIPYRKHTKDLPGRPDAVFDSRRVVVFIEGDFWHGWGFARWRDRLPLFWRRKIEINRLRDQRNIRKLRRSGWRVVRLWEHQIETDFAECMRRVRKALESGTGTRSPRRKS
jgi:DNA mismatch endonuclease (patch repair protein)